MYAFTHDNEAVVRTAVALNKLEDCLGRLGDALEGLQEADLTPTLRYAIKQHEFCLKFSDEAQKLFVMTIGLIAPQFTDLARSNLGD